MQKQNKPQNMQDGLVDIREIKIDPDQSLEERMRSYIEQVRDPYCFRVGKVKVRVSYSGEKETLNDSFCDMISNM